MKLGEITLLQVQNVGKIKFASLTLGPGGELVKIAGPNESGKSTLLDSLKMTFESAKSVPNDIIRHGANEGSVLVQTSGGYTITRKIEKHGEEQTTSLEVKYLGAPVAGGAVTFLKQFSAAYMDPEVVANYGDAEILRVMAKYAGVDLDSSEKTIATLKENSSSTRKAIKSIGVKNPPIGAPSVPIDLEAATAEYTSVSNAYNQAISKHQSATSRIRELDNLIASDRQKVEEITKTLEAANERIKVAEESKAKGQDWLLANPAPDAAIVETAKVALDSAVAAQAKLGEHKEYQLWYEQKTKLDEELRLAEKAITDTESARNQAMSMATFPDENLKIVDGKPLLGEGLWGNGSTSAKLVAAAKLCAASIPEGGARVLYIHRGESIGNDRQKLLAQFAKAHNVQILMEVMSDSPDTIPEAIIIEDGMVEFVAKDAGQVVPIEPVKELVKQIVTGEVKSDHLFFGTIPAPAKAEPALFADAPWNSPTEDPSLDIF